jgi:hypothetical protein
MYTAGQAPLPLLACQHSMNLPRNNRTEIDWRFVSVQQTVAELAKTAIDLPPMQAPASFNLDAIKAKIDEVIKNREGQ